MPKMFVHARRGMLTAEARPRVAAALTDLGMECERLANTDKVREGIWIFFSEYPPDMVFTGGQVATRPTIALVIYALKGGLDEACRTRLIAGATSILSKHVLLEGPLSAYVAIQEIPEVDWGMSGEQVSLSDLRRED